MKARTGRSARSLARLGTLLVVAHPFGCAYTTPRVHVPPSLQVLGRLDVDVANVEVVSGSNMTPAMTEGLKRDVREMLRGKRAKDAHARGELAKVVVHVDVERYENGFDEAVQQDGCALLGAPALPTGVAFENARVSVDITVTDAGRSRVFMGQGLGDKDGSVYAHARRRALAVALDRALADAAAHGALPQ